MANILLAGLLGIAFSTLQLLLMRRVFSVRSGGLRILLMLVKLPLWAIAFLGVALWWGQVPLLAFGIAAGGTYLAVAIIYYLRTHPVHRKKGE